MKVLLRGMESKRRVELLLSLTSISSESTIKALHDYLVNGRTAEGAVAINGLQQSNFNRDLKKLNDKAVIVEEIKDLDWAKFSKSVK